MFDTDTRESSLALDQPYVDVPTNWVRVGFNLYTYDDSHPSHTVLNRLNRQRTFPLFGRAHDQTAQSQNDKCSWNLIMGINRISEPTSAHKSRMAEPIFSKRAHASMANYQDKFILFSGGMVSSELTATREAFLYNIRTDKWTTAPPMTHLR